VLTNDLVLAASGFTWVDSAYQLLAFAVLLFLIKKFAWGPLVKVMRDREQYVANEIEAAEKARTEAAELLEQHKQMLKEARTENQRLIEEAKKQAETTREEIISVAKSEAERIKETAKLEIQQERAKAVAELREQVASLSVLIASKVIEKELNEKDQEALIKDYIQKAGEEL